jgi:RimJ/RimL family protein N-acetyltransferase
MLQRVKSPRPSPAYQLRTSRLMLRCWKPDDAPALTDAIVESLSELRPWMPWALTEPEDVEAKAERLRGFRALFDQDKALLYGMFDPAGTMVLGSIGMHDRIGAGAREIGYWVRTSHTRKGLATEAVAALCRMGFKMLDLRAIEIHCHPENYASAAIPRKLGFAHLVTIPRCIPNRETGARDNQIWTMSREMYRAADMTTAQLQGFDALGRPMNIV